MIFAFAMASGGIASFFYLALRHDAYRLEPKAYEDRTRPENGDMNRLLLASSDAISTATRSFQFFPSFLLLGYVGFIVNRWRDFLRQNFTLQGRLHDIALMIGGALTDPKSEACQAFAFDIHRLLTFIHAWGYREMEWHSWLATTTLDDYVALGLLLPEEKSILKDAANTLALAHALISRKVQFAVKEGLILSSCSTTALRNIAAFRGISTGLDVTLHLDQPSTWTALMSLVVDLLVLLYVFGTPFTAFVFEVGCFQVYVVMFSFLLTLPWICLMELLRKLHNPYAGEFDFFNVASLVSSSERSSFSMLRVGFDFPIEEGNGESTRVA